MKITALDIHQKEFAHGMRGYREDEVDAFLDQLAVEVDAAEKRIKELETKLAGFESEGFNFEAERNTINNTLLTAQRAADSMLTKAQAECSDTLAAAQQQYEAQLEEARQQSEQIVAEAYQKHHQLVGSVARIQGEEEKFRKRYLARLDGFLTDVRQLEAEARSAVQPLPVPKELEKELEKEKKKEPERHTEAQESPEPVEKPAAPEPEAKTAEAEPVKTAKKSDAEDTAAPDHLMAAALAESDFFTDAGAPTFRDDPEPPAKPKPVALTPEPDKKAPPSVELWGDLDDDLDIEEID